MKRAGLGLSARFLVAVGLLSVIGCGRNTADDSTASSVEPPTVLTLDGDTERQISRITLETPSFDAPVSMSMGGIPSSVEAGGTAIVAVRMQVAPTWHIYPVGERTGPSIPTKLEFELPAGFQWTAEWQIPPTESFVDEYGSHDVYTGELLFWRPILVADSVSPGQFPLTCNVTSQTCTSQSCLPPTTIELSSTIEVVK